MRLLILGGTSEAMQLARLLAARAQAGHTDIAATLSFAGRTQNPVLPAIDCRIGGFGGAEGLARYLTETGTNAVIDATHPFAARISANAAIACRQCGIPRATLTRPAWSAASGDHWVGVDGMAAAAAAIGAAPRRVFLTIGALHLAEFQAAPQHYYLVRTIDAPAAIRQLPNHQLILARGPFSVADEIKLMRDDAIDTLITKNSGAESVAAKLAAARALGTRVIMVERPKLEPGAVFSTAPEAMAWLDSHGTPPAP